MQSASVAIPAATFAPHPGQQRVLQSPARFRVVVTGRRWGKTTAGAAGLLTAAYADLEDPDKAPRLLGPPRGYSRRPARHYAIIAPTYGLLHEPLRCLADVTPVELVQSWRERASRPHVWLHGGILIECFGADRPELLVGLGLNGVWIDEAARLKAEAWRGQILPMLADRGGWAILTTTPQGPNWLHEDLWAPGIAGSSPDVACFAGKTVDNSAVPGLVAEVESARARLPARWFRREYEASFEAFEGQIFEDWDETVHVSRDLPGPDTARKTYRRIIGGIDWGYATEGAALVIGVRSSGYDVLHEEVASGRSIDRWRSALAELSAKWGVQTWYYDPSEPGLRQHMVGQVGGMVPADNDIFAGLQSVVTALHTRDEDGIPSLRVGQGCVVLRQTMPAYHWRANRQGTTTEEPAPEQRDHALDALRYAIHTHGRPAPVRAL